MDSDDLPILMSLFSVAIAAFALGWNIYRDVYAKARVRTSAARTMIHQVGAQPVGPFLSLDVTNMGPGSLKVDMILFRQNRPWYKPFDRSGGVIIYDYENPLSAKLPSKLEPGDRINLLLSWNANDPNCVFKHPITRLGVRDSFGRNHWVPRKQLRKLAREYALEFRPAPKAAPQ